MPGESAPDESVFIRHEPCPSCGSSDNLARYSDGHGHCFGCSYYERGEGTLKPTRRPMAAGLIEGAAPRELKARGLTRETCAKFGYGVAKLDGELYQVAPYHDDSGQIVAQKLRNAEKDFSVRGNLKAAGLFGQYLWTSSGKRVVITEGEIDAMSVSQVQGNKWPVVSLKNGASAAAKDIGQQIQWLMGFDEIVLMFDMDDPGQEAVTKVVGLFPPGRCKVASLPLKDANEMLVAGRGEEIINAIWQARTYRPDGILTLSDVKEMAKRETPVGLPWFSKGLTALTHGRREGETYFLGGGTGCGKTDFITQQVAFDIENDLGKTAVFLLEQNPIETATRVAGKVIGAKLHLPPDVGGYTPEEKDAALDRIDTGNLFLYDSFGATDWDPVASAIRFLVHTEGVKFVYIDHITALAAGQDDERVFLEGLTAEIASLARELRIILVVVSHLSTPEKGPSHEEGGRVMLRHFKGSRSIGYWAHYAFGIERNTQAEDPDERSTTYFRILKARFDGSKTGSLVRFGYDNEAGVLMEQEAVTSDGSPVSNTDF